MISSVAQAQASVVQQQIGIAVIAKQLSVAKQQGEAVVQLIKAAGQLGKSLGRGQRLDVVA